MKKTIAIVLAMILLAAFAGCGRNTNDTITVLTREEGSGTRDAFVELFKIQEKDADGNKVDHTSEEAETTNSTSVMMTSVAGNKKAIGYASLGSLNNSVKTVKIDGAEATVENIKSGTYKVSRPFNIATKAVVSESTQAFVDFIMSSDGQAVIESNGYISVGNNGAFNGSKVSGKVVVLGSSSVTPVMEKLKEAYISVNPNAEIEIQQHDSTAGMNSAIEGVCDIGMASRELKESEINAGLIPKVIAMDGIAVIVNCENSVTDLTSEQVKAIFTGKITQWGEING